MDTSPLTGSQALIARKHRPYNLGAGRGGLGQRENERYGAMCWSLLPEWQRLPLPLFVQTTQGSPGAARGDPEQR